MVPNIINSDNVLCLDPRYKSHAKTFFFKEIILLVIQPVQIRNISLSEGRLMILHRSQWQRAHWPQTDHLPDLAVGQDLEMKRQESV